MGSLTHRGVLATLCAVQLACSNGPGAGRRDPSAAPALTREAVLDLGVEDRANANASAASAGDFLIVAWSAATAEGAADVYAAASEDGGRTFRDPVRVNSEIGTVRVSGEQPPRIALAPRPGWCP